MPLHLTGRDLVTPLLVIRPQRPVAWSPFSSFMCCWWRPCHSPRGKRACYSLAPAHRFYFNSNSYRRTLRRRPVRIKAISSKNT